LKFARFGGVCALLLLSTTSYAQHIVRAGDFVVYSWTANDRLAQRVLEFARQYDSLPALPAAAPAFGSPIRVMLAPDDRRFQQAIGGRAPEWGVGVAVPAEGLIVLRAYGGTRGAYSELRRVFRHELAHIALHRYLEGARIPRWFNEGYATWAAGELDVESAWLLRLAFATQKAPPLDSLELSWPTATTDARVAYLLAGSVVQYLVNESGTRGLELFLQRWRASGSLESALAATYGVSLDQLEEHWRRDVRRRYGWFTVFTQSAVFFACAALGVLVLFMIRRRRDRHKLARLKETEPPDEPAYWDVDETRSDDETQRPAIDREPRPPDI
jgi:hypothetical protein